MSFTARDYLDTEYLNFQEFITTLSVTIPSLKPNTIKDEKQLLRALVSQNKAYAKKIIDLFEELSKEIFTTNNGHSKKDSETSFKITSPNKSSARKKSVNSPTKSEVPQSKENKISHLEKKIEYLNNFATESKKSLDEKTKELDLVSKKYRDLLVQHNQSLEERNGLKAQLKEMLDISDNLKNKFDIHLEDIMIEKDKEISSLKRHLDEFSRNLESQDPSTIRASYPDVNDLKERLHEKEREIAFLKSDLLALENQDSSRKSLTPNLMFEIFSKIKQLGLRLDDLNLILNKVSSKYNIEIADDSGFRRLVELSELKGDQISQVISPLYFNKVEDMKIQIEKLWDRIEFESFSSSPQRPDKIDFNQTATLKENITQVREEIQEQLKNTAQNIEKTNQQEFFRELQQEIEKNYELQQSLDDLKHSVNKIGLIITDEFDRLASLFELSTKVELADFKREITRAKSIISEFVEKNTFEPLRVDAEYENIKKRWHDKIVQQADLYNQELNKLKGVIENERTGSDKSIEKVKAEKEKLKTDIAEIENNYKQAEDRYVAKISKLETEVATQKEKIKAHKNDADVYEKLIQEREETILNYSQTINVWQDKCTSIEAENLKLLHENSKLRGTVVEKEREAELFKENNKKLLAEKSEQDKSHEAKNDEYDLIKTENEMLKEKIKEVQKESDDEKLALLEKYKALESKYDAYVSSSETKLNETRTDYEEALKQYRVQIEEKKSALEQLKVAYQEEVNTKNEELRQLVNTARSAEDLTRSQMNGLRSRDERIAQQADEIKELQIKLKGLEVQLEELSGLKEKSKKYFDMLTNSNRDVTGLKGDLQKALHERNDSIAKCNRLETSLQETKDELFRTRDQYQSARQLIEEYKAQLHAAKNEVDAAHLRLVSREKELKEFEETNLAQSKSTILYKDEIILRLKSDVKFLTEKQEDLQREYQKIIEKNEDLLFENQKLKHLALESELGLNEAEKLNNINDDLLVQIEELKKKLQEKEDSWNHERGYLKKDLSASQKKVGELEKKLAKTEKAFK